MGKISTMQSWREGEDEERINRMSVGNIKGESMVERCKRRSTILCDGESRLCIVLKRVVGRDLVTPYRAECDWRIVEVSEGGRGEGRWKRGVGGEEEGESESMIYGGK